MRVSPSRSRTQAPLTSHHSRTVLKYASQPASPRRPDQMRASTQRAPPIRQTIRRHVHRTHASSQHHKITGVRRRRGAAPPPTNSFPIRQPAVQRRRTETSSRGQRRPPAPPPWTRSIDQINGESTIGRSAAAGRPVPAETSLRSRWMRPRTPLAAFFGLPWLAVSSRPPCERTLFRDR